MVIYTDIELKFGMEIVESFTKHILNTCRLPEIFVYMAAVNMHSFKESQFLFEGETSKVFLIFCAILVSFVVKHQPMNMREQINY